MDWAWWLGTGTLGTATMTALGWLIGRGKNRAEVHGLQAATAEKLTGIAMDLVVPLEKELGRVRGDLETTAERLQDHIDDDIKKQRRQAEINAEHAVWDQQAAEALATAGIIVPLPPPLHDERLRTSRLRPGNDAE